MVPAEEEGWYIEMVREEEALYRDVFRKWTVRGEGMRLRCVVHGGDWTVGVVVKRDGGRGDERKVEFPGTLKGR